MITVLYFSWVREAIGIDGETVEPPAEIATLGDLAGWLAQRHPVLADTGRLRGAIDQKMVAMGTSIAGAREVALFPPVTGG